MPEGKPTGECHTAATPPIAAKRWGREAVLWSGDMGEGIWTGHSCSSLGTAKHGRPQERGPGMGSGARSHLEKRPMRVLCPYLCQLYPSSGRSRLSSPCFRRCTPKLLHSSVGHRHMERHKGNSRLTSVALNG